MPLRAIISIYISNQVVMLYKWNMETNAVDNMNACKGHERSVDCLAADREGKFIASGSFDTTLKIWGGKLQGSGFWKNIKIYFLNVRKSSLGEKVCLST